MRNLFNIGLFFLLLYLVLDVALAGAIKGSRPVVQGVAVIGLVFISMYNFQNINKWYAPHKLWKFIKTWKFFLGLITIYYIFSFIELPHDLGNSNPRNIVIAYYIFATCIFFYHGTINGDLNNKKLNIVLIFVLINGLFEIIYAFSFTKVRQGIETINTSAGYVFIMILPLLMYKFKKDNIWVFIITIILTLLTGKRGAIFIYVLLILLSMIKLKTVKKEFQLNWKFFLFVGIIFIGYTYFMENAFESLSHRLLNIKNEERGTIGSGRDVIWTTLLSAWYHSSSFVTLLFGFGFYSTQAIEGHIAHNDFVEFIVDFGLVGLSCYLLYLYHFAKSISPIKKKDPYLHMLLYFCLIILVGRGLISGTLRTDNINLSISTGYLLGIATLQKIKHAKSN